jgi:hypothetical protein
MPNLTQIIHAKFCPDYQCQILPKLSIPNLPCLAMPNFTQIINAKIYPAHPSQI